MTLGYPLMISKFQYGWKYSAYSCYRPAADLGYPIACIAYAGTELQTGNFSSADSKATVTSFVEFETFSPCCPLVVNNTKQIYTSEKACPAAACFTTDESVAREFDACVKREAKVMVEKLKGEGAVAVNASRRTEPRGRCEYVDYEMLRKGIVKSGAQNQNVLTLQGALVATLGLCFIVQGLF
jgi:hypothetical protein